MQIIRKDNDDTKMEENLFIGREKEEKKLMKWFMSKKPKLCSVSGPNGIGKSYLREHVVKSITGSDAEFVCYKNGERIEFVFLRSGYVKIDESKSSVEDFFEQVFSVMTDEPNIPIRDSIINTYNSKIAEIKSNENVSETMHVIDKMKVLLSVYAEKNIDIRLIFEEVDDLADSATPEEARLILKQLRDMAKNIANFYVLFVSRRNWREIAGGLSLTENECYEVRLKGFTEKNIYSLITQQNSAYQSWYDAVILEVTNKKIYGEVRYFCGAHPASWKAFYDLVWDMYSGKNQDGACAQEILDAEVLPQELERVPEQMYNIMEPSELKSFYNFFSPDIQKLDSEEYTEQQVDQLKQLVSGGFLVELESKWAKTLATDEIRPVFIQEKEKEKAYFPVSAYAANEVCKKYRNQVKKELPAEYEEIETATGTVEDAENNGYENGQNMGDWIRKALELDKENAVLRTLLEAEKEKVIKAEITIKETKEELEKANAELKKKETEVKDVLNDTLKWEREDRRQERAAREKMFRGIEELRKRLSEQNWDEQREEATAELRTALKNAKADLEKAQTDLEKAQADLETEHNSNDEYAAKVEELQKSVEEKTVLLNNAIADLNKKNAEWDVELKKAFEKEMSKRYGIVFDSLDAQEVKVVFENLYNSPADCKITEKQIEETIQVLTAFDFDRSFKVAFFMHKLFCEMSRFGMAMDYSVLTMMYSRIYERFLKKQHYRMYQVALPDVRTGTGTATFSTIAFDKLTIGMFSHDISDRKELFQAGVLSCHKNDVNAMWLAHTKSINKVQDIRNDVMHSEAGDSGVQCDPKEQLRNILEELFVERTEQIIDDNSRNTVNIIVPGALIIIAKIRDAFELSNGRSNANGNGRYRGPGGTTNQTPLDFACYRQYINSGKSVAEANVFNYVHLCDESRNPVSYESSAFRMYDNGWTRANREVNGKRTFIRSYRIAEGAPEFLLKFEIDSATAQNNNSQVTVGVRSEDGSWCEYSNVANSSTSRNDAKNKIAELWEIYVKTYKVSRPESETAESEAAATAEEVVHAGIPDTVKNAVGLFTVTEVPDGDEVSLKGKIVVNGNEYDAFTRKLRRNTRDMKVGKQANAKVLAVEEEGCKVHINNWR